MRRNHKYRVMAALVQVDFLPDAFPGAKGHSGFLEVCSRLFGVEALRHKCSVSLQLLHIV